MRYIIKVKEDSEIEFPINAEYIRNNYNGTETYEIETANEIVKLNTFLDNNDNIIDYDILED